MSTDARNPLAEHYSHFRVADRLLLTGHSHQAWPDVALEGVQEAFRDAAEDVDEKWVRAFGKAERVRDGYRALLGDPAAELALGASTHELLIRFLSAISLASRPRLVTTDGEFHTIRRQLSRLAEESIEIVRVPTHPVETLAERLADATDARTASVLVSAVLFGDARVVPGLDALAERCDSLRVELLIDVYHALGVIFLSLPATAWVVGGGYKYLQLGEGNCFLRIPEHGRSCRPVITGWFAEFEAVARAGDQARVLYAEGEGAFAGSTYDPTSHYRAARVLDFFAAQGLTLERLNRSYRKQIGLLAARFDALGLPDELITRDRSTSLDRFGGFLALSSPIAPQLQAMLRREGVLTDSRGNSLRLGPAPYLSDAQLEKSIEVLGETLRLHKANSQIE